jgi:hypothetical protein
MHRQGVVIDGVGGWTWWATAHAEIWVSSVLQQHRFKTNAVDTIKNTVYFGEATLAI